MNLKKVQIELDVSDVQQVLAIALDDDRDRALAFAKTVLTKVSSIGKKGVMICHFRWSI